MNPPSNKPDKKAVDPKILVVGGLLVVIMLYFFVFKGSPTPPPVATAPVPGAVAPVPGAAPVAGADPCAAILAAASGKPATPAPPAIDPATGLPAVPPAVDPATGAPPVVTPPAATPPGAPPAAGPATPGATLPTTAADKESLNLCKELQSLNKRFDSGLPVSTGKVSNGEFPGVKLPHKYQGIWLYPNESAEVMIGISIDEAIRANTK